MYSFVRFAFVHSFPTSSLPFHSASNSFFLLPLLLFLRWLWLRLLLLSLTSIYFYCSLFFLVAPSKNDPLDARAPCIAHIHRMRLVIQWKKQLCAVSIGSPNRTYCCIFLQTTNSLISFLFFLVLLLLWSNKSE